MNILIINNFWRYPGTKRWDFELVRYEDFICHKTNNVTYIVNTRGRTAITADPQAYDFDLHQVEDIFDIEVLDTLAQQAIAKHGPIDRIIAFSENLLTQAAFLRDKYDIHGARVDEIERARNKVLMKQLLHKDGLRAPNFIHLHPETATEQTLAFAEKHGYPLVIKPIDGASSKGVSKINNVTELLIQMENVDGEGWEVEEFITGDLFHIDGFINKDGKVTMAIAHRYFNSCLDFTTGAPLGAAVIDQSSDLASRIKVFVQQCMTSLDLKTCPFHFELFHSDQDELVFLEVGARLGGADVPHMIEDVSGENVFEHWIKQILDDTYEVAFEVKQYGAWLIFGLPAELPCTVTSVSDFSDSVASISRQYIPEVGSTLVHEGGYCTLQSGRLLFTNDCHDSLIKDVNQVMAQFSIETEIEIEEMAKVA